MLDNAPRGSVSHEKLANSPTHPYTDKNQSLDLARIEQWWARRSDERHIGKYLPLGAIGRQWGRPGVIVWQSRAGKDIFALSGGNPFLKRGNERRATSEYF